MLRVSKSSSCQYKVTARWSLPLSPLTSSTFALASYSSSSFSTFFITLYNIRGTASFPGLLISFLVVDLVQVETDFSSHTHLPQRV